VTPRRATLVPGREHGFTLLEVLVTLAILGYAVVGFQAVVGKAVDAAVVTKINRQMRHVVEYQMGQIVVGKLHPEEEDPFPHGQTGTFVEVGGYDEEYERFTWELEREEVPICGASDDELANAGFDRTNDGQFSRRQTDDVLAGIDEHLEKPKGQFKSRVRLTVRWNGPSADEDLVFSVVTYLPVNNEENQEVAPPASGQPAPGTGDPADGAGDRTTEGGATPTPTGGGDKR
jgi:prepilin-type N-terminal cleavage/methylation domain-containing protein